MCEAAVLARSSTCQALSSTLTESAYGVAPFYNGLHAFTSSAGRVGGGALAPPPFIAPAITAGVGDARAGLAHSTFGSFASEAAIASSGWS
jgi:hypothetical protein